MIVFSNTTELAALLKDAQEQHHVYEKSLGHIDANWQDWYANYMASYSFKQYGTPMVELPDEVIGADFGILESK